MFTLIFALFATYFGIGALLIHDTMFISRRGGWLGELTITVAALLLAVTWPRYAAAYCRSMFRGDI